MENDELYTGPTVLAPGASDRGRRIANKLLVPLLVLFFAVILLFYVFYTAFTVSGDSMEPTLRDQDKLLVTKSYRDPSRGDIVVFRTVDMRNRKEDLVKRVIAIPGDTVEVRQGVALVNGEVEHTPGLGAGPFDRTYVEPRRVSEGELFVMGDNRPVALDSRQIGAIPMGSVTGRAVFRFAPITRMRRIR